ncbi:MAG: DUF4097 domain-containing protein [Clostridiales Family XIII bacterium]|jgi:hypothetical protein|nr:DUF4097 domain-containing protein [Clostridiales Family XIII bacterium]
MTNAKRNWLIIAAAVFVVGAIIAVLGFTLGGMKSVAVDSKGIHVVTEKDMPLVEIDETYDSFSSIEMNTAVISHVNLVEGDRYSVTGKVQASSGKATVEVRDGTLVVKTKQDEFFGFNLFSLGNIVGNEDSSLTITYPKGKKLKNVVIESDVSDLTIDGMKAKKLEVHSDVGDTTIENVDVEKLTASVNIGKLTLSGVKAEKADIDIDTGDAEIDGLRSNGLTIESNIGSVDLSGTLLGKSEIDCDMGDLKLALAQSRDETSLKAEADVGTIIVDKSDSGKTYSIAPANPKATIEIEMNVGTARIDFVK